MLGFLFIYFYFLFYERCPFRRYACKKPIAETSKSLKTLQI